MLEERVAIMDFPRESCLRRGRDFQVILREGRWVRGEGLAIVWKKGSGRSRVGLAIGKGQARGVDRVRVRRQLREAFRAAVVSGLIPAKGVDVVWVGRAEREGRKSGSRWRAAMELLKRMGLEEHCG